MKAANVQLQSAWIKTRDQFENAHKTLDFQGREFELARSTVRGVPASGRMSLTLWYGDGRNPLLTVDAVFVATSNGWEQR